MTKVEIRFKDGSKMVMSKDRRNSIKTYKKEILVLGKKFNPLDVVGHDYYGEGR